MKEPNFSYPTTPATFCQKIYNITPSFKNIVNFLKSILLFLVISSASGLAAKPSTTADELIDYLDGKESWYGVYLATKKVGYGYEKWNFMKVKQFSSQ